jgi:hypothetical protein
MFVKYFYLKTVDTLDNIGYTLDIHCTNNGHQGEVLMTASLKETTGTGRVECERCGGLMVGEVCMDLLNSELKCVASRCVQCGEVVDPVILANRSLPRVSARGFATAHLSIRSISSHTQRRGS